MTTDEFIWTATAAMAVLIPSTRQFLFQGAVGGVVKGEQRMLEVDAAKAVAIGAVMGIHAFYLGAWSPGFTHQDWVAATIINNALRFAVPTFLFFSGFCLGLKGHGAGGWWGFFRRKLWRIFFPYAAVSGALLLGWIDGLGPGEHPAGWGAGMGGATLTILTGGAGLPFYFIIVLGQLYALYPVLLSLARRWPVCLGVGSLAVSSTGAVLIEGGSLWGFPVCFSYIFPFAIGMLSADRDLRGEDTRGWIAIASTYLAINLAVGVMVADGGAWFGTLNWYSSNSQYFYSISIAILSIAALSGRRRLVEILAPMGKVSLWIFLLHYPIQVWVWETVSPEDSSEAFHLATTMWFGSIALSLAIGALADKVRVHAARMEAIR